MLNLIQLVEPLSLILVKFHLEIFMHILELTQTFSTMQHAQILIHLQHELLACSPHRVMHELTV